VTIYDAILRIMAEGLLLGNAVLSRWVNMPENASGPLDANITLSGNGADLVAYVASSIVHLSDVVCAVVGALL
jgi:hypothetical protein